MNPSHQACSPEANAPHQWTPHPGANQDMLNTVQGWLRAGRILCWMPIWSRENFPKVPAHILHDATECPERHVWLIVEVDDFLQIPEGITGWLLPEGEKDTDVVCGLWENEVHFMSSSESSTGLRTTLQSDMASVTG